MRTLLACLTFILAFSFARADNLGKLRELYPSCAKSAANAKQFLGITSKMSSSDPVVNGYKYAAEIADSKFSKTLEQKKANLKSNISKLEKLIASHPNAVELRLIRLSVQESLPKIVGYHNNIQDDKKFILKNYANQQAALKKYIYNFALQSKNFSSADRALLK